MNGSIISAEIMQNNEAISNIWNLLFEIFEIALGYWYFFGIIFDGGINGGLFYRNRWWWNELPCGIG